MDIPSSQFNSSKRAFMAIEIERKFLVLAEHWRAQVELSKRVRQAYLNREAGFTARVRIVDDAKATLTIKSSRAGMKRLEFEYEIPLQDGMQLVMLGQGAVIEKTRHIVHSAGLVWEIDEFEGDNTGLIVAEVELQTEHQELELPDWVGQEVTGDPRYYNSNLAAKPLSVWNSEFDRGIAERVPD